ncbi:Phosphoglycolate phosphatase [hydrothermal vent metagenome]|uniref:Phosphoglycolate phosphatase n=1 Tax=hydrothermal vent metagenome TaxID=652676 RepID=A0A3B1BKU2_9ZZZZ
MKRFNVDVVVFDLDGTLIDSKEDIANSLNHTFNEVGYDPVPLKVIEGYVGNGIVPLIRMAVESNGHPEKEEEVTTLFRERYWAHLLDKTRLYPGVEETLGKLDENTKWGWSLTSRNGMQRGL